MWLNAIVSSLAALSWTATAASTFSPVRPPAYPLAVRSPYLSTWLRAGNTGESSGYLPGTWPTFWSNHVTGWAGIVRVDGQSYTWMGLPGSTTANQTSAEYTSTKTVFTIDVAGAVELTATFLSPVNPTDLKRQSLVFSYLNVEVRSTDGADHDVQVYSDVSGEWASGDDTSSIEWAYGTTGDVAYHQFHRSTQLAFSEINDQTEFGNWYYATDASDKTSYQAGRDDDVRATFRSNGILNNTSDSNYRAVNNNWPVFGFSTNFGSVGASSQSVVFSIGLAQQEAAQFNGADGYQPKPSLWTSYFADELEALQFFQGDYSTAASSASDLDKKVADDSTAAAGQDYLTYTSLTVRQAFGATQLVGTQDKVFLFMKEISSNGNFQTVDVFFPMHPILLYLNPTLLKFMMDPHYEYQESGQYPRTSAIHDLGAHYPNATGHNDGNDEQMPLEECGNMIIMTLAYAQRTNDVNYLNDHYPLLNQWAGYLVNDSLYPGDQLSTDDFAGPLPNQTNLGLKGMIGLAAMAQISNLTDHPDDAKNYSDIAHSYISQWEELGVNDAANPVHTTLNYGNETSWGLLYNLYADRELGLNAVPQWVYDMQSEYYPTVARAFGVPLDTRHSWTKIDWEIWTAAVSNTTTRDLFVQHIAKFIAETTTNRPFTDLYDADTGAFPGIEFTARPVQGASFALLALPK